MARRARKTDSVPPIEWITGIASLALVLGTLGFLAFEGVQHRAQLPELTLQVETISPTGSGHAITVVIRNLSRQAASEVMIEGNATEPGGSGVRAEARLDYVPGLSERQAILVFPVAVKSGDVKLRVLGYTTP